MCDRQLYLDIEVDELERLSKDVAIVRDARDLPPTSYLYRRGEESEANEFTCIMRDKVKSLIDLIPYN